jgi:hypothetical protein
MLIMQLYMVRPPTYMLILQVIRRHILEVPQLRPQSQSTRTHVIITVRRPRLTCVVAVAHAITRRRSKLSYNI